MGRTRRVLEALVPAIIEQKVTGDEARGGVRRPRPAPRRAGAGPWEAEGRPAPMRVPPAPEMLAGLPGYAYHPLGLERRRADAIRVVAAARAARVEECADLPLPDAYARLRALPLVGPWTAAEVGPAGARRPDAVSVGDFHLVPRGLLGAGRRGARHRRADAGAPGPVRGPPRARDPAHRGGRDPGAAPRAADGAAVDRGDLSGPGILRSIAGI